MTPTPKPPLLTRAQAVIGVVLALLGAAVSMASWAYGRGSTEAETRSAIQRASDRVTVVEQAVQRNTDAIEPLVTVPARLDAMEARQGEMHDDLRWLVRRQGGQPAGAP